MSIHKVLIANRGEIALRIIRACRELGIATVSVHSTADEYSLHRRFADEDVCIGPARSDDSYLSIPRILSAVEVTGADAIHPGYGFLAENARFAEICREHAVTFIGPSHEAIKKMGNKEHARVIAKEVGVPIIESHKVAHELDSDGSAGKNVSEGGGKLALGVAHGDSRNPVHKVQDETVTDTLRYPLIVKAAAGGGGKGMRVVWAEEEFDTQFKLAQVEALKAFGNGDLYLEQYLVKPRHIEIQVLADYYGNVMHLGERECSIQRRYQKLLEEAPSLFIDKELRERLGAMAVAIAKAVDYVGVGTVEFLVDQDKRCYFIEMNTRIQVEHPVTEMITGIDLVQAQLHIANKKTLDEITGQWKTHGHAIECRINAEDPAQDFRPSGGRIASYHAPGGFGVRVDSHAYAGYEVPPFYDSLVSKVIVWAPTRKEAIARMRRALGEYVIEGIHTTLPFHQKLLSTSDFLNGNYSTQFLEEFF